MKTMRWHQNDKGVSAIIIGGALVMLMGMAAIAIDLGRGFNERRQDQTAADMAVMSASVDSLEGIDTIRDSALTFVRSNLDTTYSDSDWQTIWEGCTDPNRDDGGFSFQSVPPPAGWSNLDCISVDPTGYIRVRVPDQFIDTTFGRVVGVDQLNTSAAAIARIGPRSEGGILPFGLTTGASSGDHVCLSSGPTGLAIDPCDGPSAGNFGTLKSPLFGDPKRDIPENCTSSPLSDVLALNIAIGLDHLVTIAPDTSAANEVRDVCHNWGVNTLLTDTGFPNNGAEQGLVGPLPSFSPGWAEPRLAQGPSTDEISRFGRTVNHKPLWDFIDPGVDSSDVPASCVKSSFSSTDPLQDWDGDGVDDAHASWQHMQACLEDYSAGGPYEELLIDAIGKSPRFGYVPLFHETTLGSGSTWLHVKFFRAMWLQGTWWRKGSDWQAYHPGEPCSSCDASGYSMKQLSAFVLPDEALPTDLRGDPPPWADGLNPFEPYLYR